MSATPTYDDCTILSRTRGATATLVVGGELDFATVPRLEAAIARALDGQPAQLTLDFSAVGFMDSAGVRAVLGAIDRTEREGVRFKVVRPEGGAAVALELCGL